MSDEKNTEKPVKEKRVRTAAQKKKLRRRIIWLVILSLLCAGGYFAWQKFGKKKATYEALTDWVSIGSISAKVEGSGLTKAKSSKTISLSTAGTVLDVFVEEGQQVMAGDPLFTVDSPMASQQVASAENEVEKIKKEIDQVYEDQKGLNLAVPFSGKLLETSPIAAGEKIGRGTPVAKLVDDTRFTLTQYYSYAYKADIKKGMQMDVSIPALMTSVKGTVSEIRYVERITPEGSKLFAVELTVPNPGILTEDMLVSAYTTVSGEKVYPYEADKLKYYQTKELTSTVDGTVLSCNIYDYMKVSAGQVIMNIDGDDSEALILSLQSELEEAEKKLADAQENQANCNAVAPIDGMVIGLNIYPGSEVASGDAVLTISDRNTITVNANVDERNISYVKVGMPVTLDQWGSMGFGTVESISLSSNISNGTATYPIVISADNSDGALQLNSYISYTIEASRSDNCLIVPLQSVKNVMLADGTEATVVYVKADTAPDNTVELMPTEDDGQPQWGAMDDSVPEGFWPVQVEIGLSDSANAEIKSGLEEGTEIFTQMVSSQVWN